MKSEEEAEDSCSTSPGQEPRSGSCTLEPEVLEGEFTSCLLTKNSWTFVRP